MKKIKLLTALISTAAIGTGIYAFGLGNYAPQNVKDGLAKKYLGVKNVKWEKESDAEWEGEFKLDGTEYSANFLEDGTWMETEYEINMKDIPSKVKSTLMVEFPQYEIQDAEKSETSHGSVFRFKIKKDGRTLEVTIDINAKIVNKEVLAHAKTKDRD